MPISRRDFLKLTGGAMGALAFRPLTRFTPLPEFPQGERLGRLTATLAYRSAPRIDYPETTKVYEDTVVPIVREVIAGTKDLNFVNQRWVETPNGYLYAGYVQPVRNQPNEPLTALPNGSGFWAEVTVPYVDMALDGAPASPWVKDLIAIQHLPRLYYSQVVWIDQIRTGDGGQILYRFNEEGGRPAGATGGSYNELFWADGRAFRPITIEEVAPISPNVDPSEKRVVVNITYQTMSCYEGSREVHFCTCSTGYKLPVEEQDKSTPVGQHTTWRKAISIHMSGGTTGAGYDTPGVSWTNLFSGTGIAIHAAFWHNHFGQAVSHGCVNVRPEDAKWVFRWTMPAVDLGTSDVTVGMPGGTKVHVEERAF